MLADGISTVNSSLSGPIVILSRGCYSIINKQQIRDERRKYIEENGLVLDGSEDVEIEDLFLSELPDAKTVQDIWNSWLKYGLESSHKQLDSYIMMKLDTEKISGTPANLDSIKEAIVKVLEKDKAEG